MGWCFYYPSLGVGYLRWVPIVPYSGIGILIFGSIGAGGLVCIIAEKQVGPVEILRQEARDDLERLQREWLKGCYEENLKRSSCSLDSERELPDQDEAEAGPSNHGFDPYALANVPYPESIYAPRQSIPTDLWRYDPGPILPRHYTTMSDEDVDDEDDFYADEEDDFHSEEEQYAEPRIDVEYHYRYSDTMSMSQPDTDELNDVLDIRSLVYFPPNHPNVEDVHSATANLSDLNSHLLGRLTPSEMGTPEPTVEETSIWEEDDGTEEEVAPRRKKKLRPRRVDSGSVRPPKNFVVRFEDARPTREPSTPPLIQEPSTSPPTREPLTIIVTPPTPLPNKGFF